MPTDSLGTSDRRPGRRGHRLWFPLGVGLLALLAWVAIPFFLADLDRNLRLMLLVAVGFLALALTLVWFVFLSRFRWRLRLVTLAFLVAAGYGLKHALRVDGTIDGRGFPRLAWKWSAPPERVFTASIPAAPRTAPIDRAGFKDVPQYFGPNRDGVVQGSGLARDWSATPPRELWRQPIGSGWAAFAVVEGRAYTQEQRGEEERVTCYDALSGASIWSHSRATRFFQWQAGEGPHATPTVDGGRVYAYGANGTLDCLDAMNGKPVWSRSVLEENGLRNLEWGVSASPLVYDDFVVVTGGEGSGPTVLAYDRQTGEPRWKSGTDRASYASPVLATLDGRRAILSFNAGTLTAHEPTTGTLLLDQRWGLDKPPKAAQPVVIGPDRVFVTAGYSMGCELFEARAGTDGTLSLSSLWKNVRLKAQFNSVAVRDGYFYGLDDGLLACVDVETGQRRWKDGRYGSGQTLIVDDLILIQAEGGDVALAEANPEAYRELGRIAALRSKTWNHPTLAGRYLLVRNDREAVAYELPLARANVEGQARTNRWEEEVRRLESAALRMPPPGQGVLLLGSSSFRLWKDVGAAFPEYAIVNHGFGGSQLSDLIHYFDRLAVPFAPSVMLVYGGDNDLASGKSPDRVLADFRELVARARRMLPKTRVAFLAIKPSPARENLLGQQHLANERVRDWANGEDGVDYLDVGTPLLDDAGKPDPAWFVEDKLHLNPAGYDRWREVLKPYLDRWGTSARIETP